jgi:phenylalanyl-tRNA synthetase beta chain
VLATNRSRSIRDLAVFETGRTFGGSARKGIEETQRVGILLSGLGVTASRAMSSKTCDFFDMKGLLEVYVEELWGVSLRLENTAPLPLDPVRSAEIIVHGRSVGFLGEIGGAARDAFDLPPDLPVLLAELSVEAEIFEGGKRVEFDALPRFPGVVRDLAFVVPRACQHAEVQAALREQGGELLVEVSLFDVYEGAQLESGEKSLAYTLTFRSPDRSLTNEEVDAQVDRITKHLGKKLGARIR